jgi:hypothetical protein
MKSAFLIWTALLLLVMFKAGSAFGQVQVTVLPSKSEYLEREPIFLIVRVTNIGVDPVAYGDSGQVEVTVIDQQKWQRPSLWGCYAGYGVGGGLSGGNESPPMLDPGQSKDLSFLLRDYRLEPGHYKLRGAGKAPVRWNFIGNYTPFPPTPPRTSKFKDGDLVPGERFDQQVEIHIKSASVDELKLAFASYIRDSESFDTEVKNRAREAVSEMAPPFLEKTIVHFAEDAASASLAVKGLSRIDTVESRADLVKLFDGSADLGFRAMVVEALAEMSSSDQISFFSSLLPGHISPHDDAIRQWAVLAIGRLGGDRGVTLLDSFLNLNTSISPSIRSAVAIALGNTASAKAIPTLIELYGDEDGSVRNSVCGSLDTLTHRSWCDGSEAKAMQTFWRAWWKDTSATTKIYGSDPCPKVGESPELSTGGNPPQH